MERPIVFVVVTADKYELPVFCGDSSNEVAKFLGMGGGGNAVAARLVQAKDGIVKTKNGKYKYMRLNPETGEVYVGKLPREVINFLVRTAMVDRGHEMRRIISIKDGVETVYDNIHEAVKASGAQSSQIYGAIRNGYRCYGSYWRYE